MKRIVSLAAIVLTLTMALSLAACGSSCEGCNGCDNLGGGRVDTFYQPYIDGEKELWELNAEYRRGLVR